VYSILYYYDTVDWIYHTLYITVCVSWLS